jgi:hypothetical protein
LMGVAKRLAKNPPGLNFGYRLHNHLGANVLAARCKAEGRPHPRIVAMQAGMAWKKAGRPALAVRQLAV